MAKLLVDWAAVEREYLKGIRPQVLREQFKLSEATLRSRIVRQGWAKKREKIVAVASQKAVQVATNAVAKVGATAFVERVQKLTNQQMDVLEENQPLTMSELDKHVTVLEKVNRVGRQAYGLDGEGGGSKHLHFHMGGHDEPPKSCLPVSDAVLLPSEPTGLAPVPADASPDADPARSSS